MKKEDKDQMNKDLDKIVLSIFKFYDTIPHDFQYRKNIYYLSKKFNDSVLYNSPEILKYEFAQYLKNVRYFLINCEAEWSINSWNILKNCLDSL